MHWNEFLSTARRLASGATEGDWRFAISRAYYAVFHSFREWFLSFGIDIGQGGSAHSSLYIGLNNCGDATVANVANRINDLRLVRVRADYELSHRFRALIVQTKVVEAQSILSDFQTILLTAPPQLIADGAKNHLKSIGRIP